MGAVVKLGRSLAVQGTGDQVRRPRILRLNPNILGQESEAGVGPAALVKEHRDHSKIRPARGMLPDLTVDGGVDLALLPRSKAVRADHHGNRVAVGEAVLQRRRPVVARAQVPVILERSNATLRQRLCQALDIRDVTAVIAEEYLERFGHASPRGDT